jgi:hypothetical protein
MARQIHAFQGLRYPEFQNLVHRQLVGLQGLYLHRTHKHRHTDIHACSEWDSSTWSHFQKGRNRVPSRSSGRCDRRNTRHTLIARKFVSVLNLNLYIIWRSVVELHAFLATSLDGGEWLASGLREHTSGESFPIMHRRGHCVVPEPAWIRWVKSTTSAPVRNQSQLSSHLTCNLDTLLTELGWLCLETRHNCFSYTQHLLTSHWSSSTFTDDKTTSWNGLIIKNSTIAYYIISIYSESFSCCSDFCRQTI